MGGGENIISKGIAPIHHVGHTLNVLQQTLRYHTTKHRHNKHRHAYSDSSELDVEMTFKLHLSSLDHGSYHVCEVKTFWTLHLVSNA